jgi:hypothetical protein
MTRLRPDRMLRRVRETRTVELLRASGEEVRAALTQPAARADEPDDQPADTEPNGANHG